MSNRRNSHHESVKPHYQPRNQQIPNSQSNPSYHNTNYRNQKQGSNLNNHNNTRNYKGNNTSSNASYGQRSSSNNKNYNYGNTHHTGNNYSKPRSGYSNNKTSNSYDKRNNNQAYNPNITETKKRYPSQNDRSNFQSHNQNPPSKKNPSETRNLHNNNYQYKAPSSNTDPRYSTRKTQISAQPNDFGHKKSGFNSNFDTNNPFHSEKNLANQQKPAIRSRKHRNESVNTFGAAQAQAHEMIQNYNYIENNAYENDPPIHTQNTNKNNNPSHLHNPGKSTQSAKIDNSYNSNKPIESSYSQSQHKSTAKGTTNNFQHQNKSTERSPPTKSQHRSAPKESDATNGLHRTSRNAVQPSLAQSKRRVTFKDSDTANDINNQDNSPVPSSLTQSQRNDNHKKLETANDYNNPDNSPVPSSLTQSQRNANHKKSGITDDYNNQDKPSIPSSLTQSQRNANHKKSGTNDDYNNLDKLSIPSSLTQSQRNVTPKKSNATKSLYTTSKPPTSSSLSQSKRRSTLKESGRQASSNYRNSDQSNPRLKSIAEETLDIIKKGGYEVGGKPVSIKSDIANCVSKTRTIRPTHYQKDWRPTAPSRGKMCSFEVVPESAFGAARKFVQQDKKKTCVLNFASATKPGGGFMNGKQAQEESLSRQSALYQSIKDSEMYGIHKDKKGDDLYTDYMIYSPDVPVFRDDKDEEKLLPEKFMADVITSAAPNKASYQKKGGKMNLKPLIENRCRKIVQCAIDNNNDVLVLGAYGCGVFGNDPKEISQAFKKILVDENYGKYFDKVVFAIPGQKSNNFRVFSSEFH